MQGLAPGGGPAPARERPGARRAPRRPGRVRGTCEGGARLGELRAHRGRAQDPGRRRDPGGPVRQADRRAAHGRRRPGGADGQRQPRGPVCHAGELLRAGKRGADHVGWAHGRRVAVHRRPGRDPGNLRDLRGGGARALRREPRRAPGGERRARRNGLGPAAGGGRHARRGARVRGGRRGQARAPAPRRLGRSRDRRRERGALLGPGRRRRAPGAVGGRGRERGRPARAAGPRAGDPGRGDRSHRRP